MERQQHYGASVGEGQESSPCKESQEVRWLKNRWSKDITDSSHDVLPPANFPVAEKKSDKDDLLFGSDPLLGAETRPDVW